MSRITGTGASGTFNKGDREWVRRAKCGQLEKSPGWEGGGALMVTGPEPAIGMSVWWRGTGAGAEGPPVEAAAVSVVGTLVLGGGVSGG